MEYYDAIENAWFKKRKDGKYIFYPYGSFGHGYVITEGEAKETKGFIGAFYAIGLLIAIAGIITFKILPIAITIEVLVYYIFMRKRLKKKERSLIKIRNSEVIENIASKMPIWILIAFMLSALTIFGFMLFMVTVVLETITEKLLTLLFAVFIIYCFWLTIRMISYKLKQINPKGGHDQ